MADPTAPLDLDIFRPPSRDDPYPALRQLRAQQPVFYSQALEGWVVTRYDDIAAISDDPERFSNADATRLIDSPPEVRAVLEQGYPYDEMRPLLTQDPPRHRRVRKVMAQALAKRVVRMEPEITTLTRRLISDIAPAGEADLVHHFCYPLPLFVVLALQGIPVEQHAQLEQWSRDKMTLQWGGPMPLEQHLAHAHGYIAFQRYLAELVEDRRREPRDDVLSDLANGTPDADHAPLEVGEVVGQMMGLIAAGHETTANLLAQAIYHLLRDPDAWQALVADPSTAGQVVEEALRFCNSVVAVRRTAVADTVFGDVAFRAGDRLHLFIGSANHDETKFAQPERFAPQHSREHPHMAFGHGIHFCIGAALARLEARIALQELATAMPGLRLAEGFDHLEFLPNSTLRTVVRLPVRW